MFHFTEARLLILIVIASYAQRRLFVDSCIIPKNTIKSSLIDYQVVTGATIASVLLLPSISRAQSLQPKECDNAVYAKSVFNIPPAAFKFPSFFEGIKLHYQPSLIKVMTIRSSTWIKIW